MDQPDIDEGEHQRALGGLARVNRISRSAAMIWKPIEQQARFRHPEPTRVLDLACGSGDLLISLARRAQRTDLSIEFTGCDLSGTAISAAKAQAEQHSVPVEFRQADVLADPFEPAHIVCSSLFLHHLEEPSALRLLGRMRETATELMLINDLIRSRLGYLLAFVGTRVLTRSRVVHIDGPLSVRAAFSMREAERLARQAGWRDIAVQRRFPERFLLSGRPESPLEDKS